MPNQRRHVVSYRSGLEQINAEHLRVEGVPYEYEVLRIPFLQPAKMRQYTPDFLLLRNGILIETKGQFATEDRQKHILIREQHPLIDLRFVFSNPRAKIYKGATTTHAVWAEKHGFLWAAKLIPQAWIEESVNKKSLDYINKLRSKK